MIYYIIFFIVVTWFLVAGQRSRAASMHVLLMLSMTGLALFVGFSDMLGGYDRYIYAELFDDVANHVSAGLPVIESTIFEQYSKELGYDFFNVLVACFTENRYIFILITTCVIYVLLYQSIKKYCENYPFAIILFLGLWFFFTFTYLRQVMGVAIAWLAIQYVYKRDLKRFLLVIAIAVAFHNSALVLLPLYWVPIRKFSRKRVIWFMAVIFLLGLTPIPAAIFDAYGEVDAQRAGVVGVQSGFRFAYLVEAFFFLLLILLHYDEIPNDRKHIVLLNLALIFCAILLAFIRNDNGGRMGWYYMIGVIATITHIATHTRRNRTYALLMVVVCFFLFQRIVSAWGVQLTPYKTFLTDGVRDKDIVWQTFEYDHSYDYDKMCRTAFRFEKPVLK